MVRQLDNNVYRVILFCLLGAVVDPMKEACNKAAVDFLISDLLKHAVTKHKKGTETSVNPEEDQSVEDHDESLNFDR